MTAVFDTNVFISAAGTRKGLSWRCFVLFARRRFQLAITREILAEYEKVAERLVREPGPYHGMKWRPLFQWLKDKAACFQPAPLGKQRSRDADDDIFLACGVASRATYIVSHDRDLLALEKPFGIEIVTPAVLLSKFT